MVVMPLIISSSSSSSLQVIIFLLRGAGLVVVVPVPLPSIAVVTHLPSPLFCLWTISIVISAPAVMGVVPPSPDISFISALPATVVVAVMLPGVCVKVVILPEIPCLLPPSLGGPAGFVSILGLHPKGPVQVSLHVGVQMKGAGHQ